jgi:hypothetical protein
MVSWVAPPSIDSDGVDIDYCRRWNRVRCYCCGSQLPTKECTQHSDGCRPAVEFHDGNSGYAPRLWLRIRRDGATT